MNPTMTILTMICAMIWEEKERAAVVEGIVPVLSTNMAKRTASVIHHINQERAVVAKVVPSLERAKGRVEEAIQIRMVSVEIPVHRHSPSNSNLSWYVQQLHRIISI